MRWKITFDPAKRERTLRERGLDFLDAGLGTRHVVSMRKSNEREIKAYWQQFEKG